MDLKKRLLSRCTCDKFRQAAPKEVSVYYQKEKAAAVADLPHDTHLIIFMTCDVRVESGEQRAAKFCVKKLSYPAFRRGK